MSTTEIPSSSVLYDAPIVTAERSNIASPIGLSSILVGAVVAIGAWFVLHLFGIGVGLTTIEPGNASSLRGAGIGAGVWSLIAPVLALCLGGLVVGRVAPTINTLNAAIHGAAVWAVASIVGLVITAMVIASMARGVAATGSAVVNVAGEALAPVAGQLDELSLPALGINAADLVAPINERLRAAGMPPVDPENLAAAAKEALERSVRQGGVIDRATMVSILAQRTALSRPEVERIAAVIEQRLSEVGATASSVASQVAETALQAAETTGKLLLLVSFSLIVSFGAAVGGAVISVRRERREHVILPRATAGTP